MIEWWADDYGYNLEADKAIQKMSQAHMLSGYSVLATHMSTSTYPIPGIPTYLHVNLIEGKPITNPPLIPSLINSRGQFYPAVWLAVRAVLGLVSANDVGREIQAQYSVLIRQGFVISGLNTHQHSQMIGQVGVSLTQFAHSHSLKILQYTEVGALTGRAKIRLFLLRIVHFLSSGLFSRRPQAVHKKGRVLFMSWESAALNIRSLRSSHERTRLVIHPGLPYDTAIDFRQMSSEV